MYFSNFPKTLYQISDSNYKKQAEHVLLTDITRNYRFKREVIDKITNFNFYIMEDNETIEIVSEKLYGSPYYHWILMLLNDRYDYIYDFALPADIFEQYIKNKYGNSENAKQLIVDIIDEKKGISTSIEIGPKKSIIVYDDNLKMPVIKFINKNTGQLTTPPDFSMIQHIKPIFAYDYENKINEEKRNIKVLSEQALNIVLRNFREFLS